MSVVLHFIKHAGKAFVVHLSCPTLNVVSKFVLTMHGVMCGV